MLAVLGEFGRTGRSPDYIALRGTLPIGVGSQTVDLYCQYPAVMLLDWIDTGWIGSGWILDGLDHCGGRYWMDWIDLRKSSWIQ